MINSLTLKEYIRSLFVSERASTKNCILIEMPDYSIWTIKLSEITPEKVEIRVNDILLGAFVEINPPQFNYVAKFEKMLSNTKKYPAYFQFVKPFCEPNNIIY
jgi:hypothetical protein